MHVEDRFIFRRSNHSIEAANYLLKKKNTNSSDSEYLDVLGQTESLKANWQKKCMHNLMMKENTIPGLGQKQILRGNCLPLENKSTGSLATKPRGLLDGEYIENGIWKANPRKKPLIGSIDSLLALSSLRSPTPSGRCLIDWGSMNIIAAVRHGTIVFFRADMPESLADMEVLEANDTCCLKWSNAGNQLAICTMSSQMQLYSLESQKIVWFIDYSKWWNSSIYVRGICWSHDDKYIVTCCGKYISVFLAKTGFYVERVAAHEKTIVTIAFSTNHQYLASSSTDATVRVFLWPSLVALMDIAHNGVIKALAWHPLQSNLICVGGSLGDASLSLWDVNKLKLVSFRLVDFFGAVEHLAWNKISGELVAHWRYWDEQNAYSIVPVLGSLDHIVDQIPLKKEFKVSSIIWNPDHTQIALKCKGYLKIFNFFGYENQRQIKRKKLQKLRDTNVGGFSQFRIR